jgi:hypothetical protein
LTSTWAPNGRKQVSTELLIGVALQRGPLHPAVCYFSILTTPTTLPLIHNPEQASLLTHTRRKCLSYRSCPLQTTTFKVGRTCQYHTEFHPHRKANSCLIGGQCRHF